MDEIKTIVTCDLIPQMPNEIVYGHRLLSNSETAEFIFCKGCKTLPYHLQETWHGLKAVEPTMLEIVNFSCGRRSGVYLGPLLGLE